jgi:hypothetical protein
MIKGIVQISGEKGVGKTSMALSYPGITSLNDLAVFNFDSKTYPMSDKYGFYKSYLHMLADYDLANKQSDPELDLAEQVIKDFSGAYGKKVVIMDSWEVFTKGLLTWTSKNAQHLKQIRGTVKMQTMTKLGHAKRMEVAFLDTLIVKGGVETIFVINHLKPEWISPTGNPDDGIRTGRDIPDASETLEQKAVARFWLKHNRDHPCPIAIVLKDPGVHKFIPGAGFEPYRAFPDRLSTKALGDMTGKNVSLWDIIDHYQNEPLGARVQTDYEHATPDEFAMISSSLSQTQREVWENNQKLALLLGDNYNTDLIDTISELKKQGKTVMEVFNELKERNISFPKVKGTYESV